MVKKRLIFTLLYSEGAFMLSRNFRLQRVGDAEWLNKNYNFSNIATSIDELIILDVSRDVSDTVSFCEQVQLVTKGCFMPLALGGNIVSQAQVEKMMSSGADKIVLNTVLQNDTRLVCDFVSTYGSQCVIASVDYRFLDGDFVVFVDRGREQLCLSLRDYLGRIADLGVGEVYLNSMDKDGTGQGFDEAVLGHIEDVAHLPIIMAGGAGNYRHLLAGIKNRKVDAVATANLFNFIGDGLPQARNELINSGIPLAQW